MCSIKSGALMTYGASSFADGSMIFKDWSKMHHQSGLPPSAALSQALHTGGDAFSPPQCPPRSRAILIIISEASPVIWTEVMSADTTPLITPGA